MFNPDKKQFIFKQTTGNIWSFFYDERLGLCYSLLNKRNIWQQPVSLQKNLLPFFWADIDEDDHFHILFMDTNGDIHYSKLEGPEIKTAPILKSKTASLYDKHLFLIPTKKNIHIFYTIQYNNSVILAHQILSEGKVSTPTVIDYVISSDRPYTCMMDRTGNIYAFYQCSDGKNLQLGCKKYNSGQRHWSEFAPVTSKAFDFDCPSVIADENNILHICYQRRSSRQFELVYQQKMAERNMWANETVISISGFSFENSYILKTKESLIIYWVRDDNIYFSSSTDNGVTWSKPLKYMFTAGRQLMYLIYKSNATLEYNNLINTIVPGVLVNGLKIAFYHESSNQSSNLSAEEVKTLLIDGMKLLKSSIEELRDSFALMEEKISKLSALQQSTEKEFVKLSLKLNMLENEVSSMRSSIISELSKKIEMTEKEG